MMMVAALLLLSVFVDFASKFMSIGADLILIGLAVFFYKMSIDNSKGK